MSVLNSHDKPVLISRIDALIRGEIAYRLLVMAARGGKTYTSHNLSLCVLEKLGYLSYEQVEEDWLDPSELVPITICLDEEFGGEEPLDFETWRARLRAPKT